MYLNVHSPPRCQISAGRFTRDTLVAHGVSSDKIRIIPHGVNSERFSVAPPRRNRPFRFVFVGSISSRKGVPVLLDAWRRLTRADAELWLVADVAGVLDANRNLISTLD